PERRQRLVLGALALAAEAAQEQVAGPRGAVAVVEPDPALGPRLGEQVGLGVADDRPQPLVGVEAQILPTLDAAPAAERQVSGDGLRLDATDAHRALPALARTRVRPAKRDAPPRAP